MLITHLSAIENSETIL